MVRIGLGLGTTNVILVRLLPMGPTMSVEKAKQLFQSSQVAYQAGKLEEALDQTKLGLELCDADDGEVHAALLDLQASVETAIKKRERSRAERRLLSRTMKEVAVRSPS